MFKLCVIMKQNNISLIKLSSIFYLTKQCGWKDKGIKSCFFSKESLPAVPAWVVMFPLFCWNDSVILAFQRISQKVFKRNKCWIPNLIFFNFSSNIESCSPEMFLKWILEISHSSFLPPKALYFTFCDILFLDFPSKREFLDIFCWLSFYRPQRRLRPYLIYLALLLSLLPICSYWTRFSWFL